MSKDSLFSQDKLISGDEKPSNPYPVPQNMRTRRFLPRVIASLLTVAWLITLGIGTLALARKEQQDLTPFDQVFVRGNSYWGASLGESKDPVCLAYFQTSFTPPELRPLVSESPSSELESPQLEIKGAIRYLVFNKAGLALVNLQAYFSDVLRLTRVESSVQTGDALLTLRGEKDNPKFEISIQAGELRRELSIARPEPVYLSRREKDRFSLRLPPDAEQLLNQPNRPGMDWNLSLHQLDETSFEECRTQVQSENTDEEKHLIDIGRYLSLLRISEEHDIVNKLTKKGTADYDQAD